MVEPQPALVVVVGPTAAGKSDRAVELALALGGEIVSADSMQVYRHFDIGTGKLPLGERRGVPHHLLDVCDPAERFSAATFVERADSAINAIAKGGRVPVVVGGTGLYVRALLKGLFNAPPPDADIRAEHEAQRQAKGLVALYEWLQEVDPVSAASINPNDFVRISRALEVYQQTGQRISTLRQQHAFACQRYPALVLGISLESEELRARIEARVDGMMAQGWLDEVRALVAAGYEQTHAMGALGYRQLSQHLRGEFDLDEAVRLTKRDTWRFSRRQRNWFSQEAEVNWKPLSVPFEPADVVARLGELRR
ncbi:MAG: tRNA (adenosine(37)-N6)-dimethylallyltransferase MiaA [Deltaproteobacteria bacterium]|nr:tRNA (adenosine(37)-N6)-dimethylallyltransferase MiaA [Deltaproteobacteria bacterium]